jgi:hypothetical protein
MCTVPLDGFVEDVLAWRGRKKRCNWMEVTSRGVQRRRGSAIVGLVMCRAVILLNLHAFSSFKGRGAHRKIWVRCGRNPVRVCQKKDLEMRVQAEIEEGFLLLFFGAV